MRCRFTIWSDKEEAMERIMKDSSMKRNILVWTLFLMLICPGLIGLSKANAEELQTRPKAIPDIDTQEYLIGPEDILEISIWKNPELSKVVTVRPDGMISLPLIGDVKAAGRSADQIRAAITEKLREYQQTVVVSVIVQGVNSYKVFILGEVFRPGLYLLKERMTLLQAIVLAGGFTPVASKNKIVVIRRRVDGNPGEEKILIRFDDIVDANQRSDKNLTLRAGDTIYVP